MKETMMSEQEIFDTLSVLECELFYRQTGLITLKGVTYADMMNMHNMINEALKEWHRLTGCTLQ